MMIATLTKKMIDFYDGSLHDITHFLKVWGYAKTIGELEGLDAETQKLAEINAICHDIACPLCREKYGKAFHDKQEEEGAPMTIAFLQGSGLTEAEINRISFVVGHHHTYEAVDGLDFQVLYEADYLTNAEEMSFTKEHIQKTYDEVFKTKSGKALLKSIYPFIQ